MWDMLTDKAKMFEAIGEMRALQEGGGRDPREVEKAKATSAPRSKQSRTAERFRTTKQPKDTPARKQEAKDNLNQQARKRAGKSGLKPEAVERELLAERQGVDHVVDTEEIPGRRFSAACRRAGHACSISTSLTSSTQTSTPGRAHASAARRTWRCCSGHSVTLRSTPSRIRAPPLLRAGAIQRVEPRLEEPLKALKTISVVETEAEIDADIEEEQAAA